jgi:glycosyltransferase involved in cell wall biosynthesis
MRTEEKPVVRKGSGAIEVPEYRAIELAPRSSRYCIAVFVINEGEKLLKQLERMAPFSQLVDVLVADGGSTDGSVEPDGLRSRGVNTLLVKTGPGRLGAQMRMAFHFALDRGYDGVITIDGNNKDDPSAVPRFVEALEGGVDHVQGSRFIPGGEAVNTPLSRHLAVRFIHAPLIRVASGFPYTDTTNGFRAYSRKLLTSDAVRPFRNVFPGYELHYYLAIRAAELGLSVKEVPVRREYPAKGPTPTKISPFRGNLKVLRNLFAACRHKFDP